jgi:hypothetical protein
MIGQTISHYRILEKLGEVPIRLNFASGSKQSSMSDCESRSLIDSGGGGGSTTSNNRTSSIRLVRRSILAIERGAE